MMMVYILGVADPITNIGRVLGGVEPKAVAHLRKSLERNNNIIIKSKI